MTKSRLVYTAFIVTLTLALITLYGCDALRFAPSEAQKQTAQLGVDSTTRIRIEGTPPGSADAVIANESARTTQSYFGLPTQPSQPPEVVIPQAKSDSSKRPDPWDTVDLALAVGFSLATGFGGKKLVGVIGRIRQESQALRQIVSAEENLRQELKAAAGDPNNENAAYALETLESLKAKNSIQTPATQAIVTEIKSAIPTPPPMPKTVPFKSGEPAV